MRKRNKRRAQSYLHPDRRLERVELPNNIDIRELTKAFSEVEQRHRAFDALSRRLANGGSGDDEVHWRNLYLAASELSATDLFVEKAHLHLQARASFNKRMAAATGFLAVVGIGVIAYLLLTNKLEFNYGSFTENRDRYAFIYQIVRAIAVDAILLGFVYFMGSLCRAFLHEATLMENRLHAARLGRLFVYLKFAGSRRPREIVRTRKALLADELINIFGWNIETSTAFKDINAKNIASGILGQATALLSQALDVAKNAQSITQSRSGRDNDD